MINNLQNKKELSKKLKERAIIEGFTMVGIASIPGSSRIKLRTNALERWLSNNHHAEMKWMEAEKRKNIGSLLEKAWAEEAGIGWIGKNSNLISKKNGSWFTLGFMLLTKDLMPDKPHQSLCGKCDLCIEHCPTKAIVEPFVIQSDLCIAYHTIESREKTIPKKIEKNLGGWVAGCDICQDVCPWNKSVPYNNNYETTPKEWIKNLNLESINWDDKTWQENLKGTTLKRIKPWMWKRNIQANIKNKKIKI